MKTEESGMQFSPGALECRAKMEKEGLPGPVVENFLRLYRQVELGRTGVIEESEIEPVPQLDSYEDIAGDAVCREAGEAALSQLVVCKLNGGLGTGMGLERAKSLLPVRGASTFNHVIAEQLLYFREKSGIGIPLIHMTSFSTEQDIAAFMDSYPGLCLPGLPPNFNQHKHPKIYADSLLPASEPDDALNWNPPGHGDLYAALMSTGTLDRLIAAGKRYIFVSNADNLGATPDAAILGYIVRKKLPFLMEAAQRTAADRKGGHLAVRRSDKRLILREAAQAPAAADGSPIPEFQDEQRYAYFNSNSQWGDLIAWRDAYRQHGEIIPLPLIRNEKSVNPRDSRSRKVYQIESAMGAAIEVFPGAGAVLIPRSRFSPVKNSNDLLGVRSDAYTLYPDHSLGLSPERREWGPPVISLDGKYYKLIDDFDARFAAVPSLIKAREFSVSGDFVFRSALAIEGKVRIIDKRSTPSQLKFDERITHLRDESYILTDNGPVREPLV